MENVRKEDDFYQEALDTHIMNVDAAINQLDVMNEADRKKLNDLLDVRRGLDEEKSRIDEQHPKEEVVEEKRWYQKAGNAVASLNWSQIIVSGLTLGGNLAIAKMICKYDEENVPDKNLFGFLKK